MKTKEELRRLWFKQLIEQVKDDLQFTQEELGAALGLTGGALSKRLKNGVDPHGIKVAQLQALAALIDESVDDLLAKCDEYVRTEGKSRPAVRASTVSGKQVYNAILVGDRDTRTLAAQAIAVVFSSTKEIDKSVNDIYQVFRDAIANANLSSIPESIQQILREERSPTPGDIYWLLENTRPVNNEGQLLDSDDLSRIAGIEINGEPKKRPQNGDMPNGDVSHSR